MQRLEKYFRAVFTNFDVGACERDEKNERTSGPEIWRPH